MDHHDREILREIVKVLRLILQKQDAIMQGLDNLKAALAAQATEIDTDFQALSDKVTALTNAATGDSDADVQALADQVNASVAALKAKAASVLSPTGTVATAAASASTGAGASTGATQGSTGQATS